MYKLIAIDLDDTLLTDDHQITPENKKALSKAKEAGIKIVLCSGRALEAMKPYANELADVVAYVVSYNGAYIIDWQEKEVLFEKYLYQEDLQPLVDLGRAAKVDIQLYHGPEYFTESYTDNIKKYEEITNHQVTVLENLEELYQQGSYKVLYNGERSILLQLEETLLASYGHHFNIFFSKPTYLEVLPKDVDKGKALLRLGDHLAIGQEEMIAIGDSHNDLSMLQVAGLGVAMKNGRKTIQEQADYITQGTNNQSGVAEVLWRFALGKEKA